MKKEDALKRIPAEGFIKLGSSQQKNLDPSRRAALIRKGNELFNNGNIQTSKRIFLTTGYSDGIERIGDILEALRMYWIAPAPVKKQQLIEQCAAVLQHWINQEG
jgi:hypothetical protein